MASCSLGDADVISQSSDRPKFDIEKVKAKLDVGQGIVAGKERVLFEDFVISLTFNGNLDYHLIPYDYAMRFRDSSYNFNQYLLVDNSYNIRDFRIYNKLHSDRYFSFHDVSNAITSFSYGKPIGRNDQLIIMEFDLSGDFMDAYQFEGNESINGWSITSNIISVEYGSGRYQFDCGELGGTAWFWVPYPGAPEPEWIFLYADCRNGGGNYDIVSSPGNNGDAPSIVDIRTNTCYSVGTVQDYHYLGLELPWLGVYKPAVTGDLKVSRTTTERADGSFDEQCTESASTFVIGASGHMNFVNLNATAVNQTRARHGWSTHVNCSWIQVQGTSIACIDNDNHSVYVDYPEINSVEISNESCICN